MSGSDVTVKPAPLRSDAGDEWLTNSCLVVVVVVEGKIIRFFPTERPLVVGCCF
jgi:hypothetical protein